MKRLPQPIMRDKEIILDPNRVILSKVNNKGDIEFVNDYLTKVSMYSEWELMGKQFKTVIHPDVPKAIYQIMWERLQRGKNMHAVIKYLSKDGRYYWAVTDFQHKYDESGNLVAFYSIKKAVPSNVKEYFSKLYKKLSEIERIGGVSASRSYLQGLLQDSNMSYDDFILHKFNTNKSSLLSYMRKRVSNTQLIKKKSFISRLFS